MDLEKIIAKIKQNKILTAVVVALIMGASVYLGAFDMVADKVEDHLEEDVIVEAPEDGEVDAVDAGEDTE